MTTEEILKLLQPLRDRWKRPAWRPTVADGEGAGTASRFGGRPWLGLGEEWPGCRRCRAAMPLFLQLNLDRLPEEAQANRYGSGLIQLFYCIRCSEDSWNPDSETKLVRLVEALDAGKTVEPTGGSFPGKQITGWERFEDGPDPEEHRALGLEVRYDFERGTTVVSCPQLQLRVELNAAQDLAEQVSRAASKDKLAGWPRWIQGVDYPRCRTCGQQMRLVFQLGSEDHVPFVFGDAGTGHVMQCPEHEDVLTFGWSCG